MKYFEWKLLLAKKKENSRTLIFRIFINEFAKVKAIRSTRNNSQEFHSGPLENQIDGAGWKNVQHRNSALRRRFASKSMEWGETELAVTENRNRLFQIRAPTYSPTHPPTIRASAYPPPLSRRLNSRLSPLLCKSTRLDVTRVLPRRFFPSSSLFFSYIFRRFRNDEESIERGDGVRNVIIIRWKRIANNEKETSNPSIFEIHPVEKYLNGGIGCDCRDSLLTLCGKIR